MQTENSSFRDDRNERGYDVVGSALIAQITPGAGSCDGAIDTKLPLIAGISRNAARLQFVQRFPDEIALA
jgi:hypothetical protein